METKKTKAVLFPVREWNSLHRGTILVYTLGHGSMIDRPRLRGWVVQKFHVEGGERSKFHMDFAEALTDYRSDNF